MTIYIHKKTHVFTYDLHCPGVMRHEYIISRDREAYPRLFYFYLVISLFGRNIFQRFQIMSMTQIYDPAMRVTA